MRLIERNRKLFVNFNRVSACKIPYTNSTKKKKRVIFLGQVLKFEKQNPYKPPVFIVLPKIVVSRRSVQSVRLREYCL